MPQEEKRLYGVLREEHTPCSLLVKSKEEEIARVSALASDLEARLAREIKDREDKLAGLQEQLDVLQTRHNQLREEHAPCSSTIAGLRGDVARAEQVRR